MGGERNSHTDIVKVAMSPRSISHLVPSMGPIVSAAKTLYIASYSWQNFAVEKQTN